MDLDEQRQRDQKKWEICKREGIDLIEILYDSDIEAYIRYALEKKEHLTNSNS